MATYLPFFQLYYDQVCTCLPYLLNLAQFLATQKIAFDFEVETTSLLGCWQTSKEAKQYEDKVFSPTLLLILDTRQPEVFL